MSRPSPVRGLASLCRSCRTSVLGNPRDQGPTGMHFLIHPVPLAEPSKIETEEGLPEIKAESGRTWLFRVAKVAAFLIAINQVWADEGKARTAPATETAAAQQTEKLTETNPSSQATIEQVQVIQIGQQVQVRIEGTGRLSYLPSGLSNPDRLVLDFSGAQLRMGQKLIPSNLPPVRRVRVGQFKADVARVVIDLDAQVPYSISANENAVTVVLRPDVLVGTRAVSEKEKERPFVAPAVPAEPRPAPMEPMQLAAPVPVPKQPSEYKKTEVEPAKKSSLEAKAETPPEAAAPEPPPKPRLPAPVVPPIGARRSESAIEPGQVYLEIKSNIDGTQLQGNRERSFLHEGANLTSEVSFFSNTPVLGIRRFEHLVVFRYTDNPRVDPERNTMQRAYLRFIGPSFEANVGDSLVNYSRLTFSQNIKGLNLRKNLTQRLRITGTVGFFTDRWGSLYRNFTAFRDLALDCQSASKPGEPAPGCIESPPGSNQFVLSPVNPGKPYARLVGGARLEERVGRNGWLAANWSHGKDLLQSLPAANTICEDLSTGARTIRLVSPGCSAGETEVAGSRRPSPEAINNDVLSVDTKLESRALRLRLGGEFAYSWTSGGAPPAGANSNNFVCAFQPPIVGAAVLDSRCFAGQASDYAGRFDIAQRLGKFNWRVDYSRFQPNFFSANARQIRDLQDFSIRSEFEFARQFTVVGLWRRSNDNLNGQRDFTSLVRAPEVRLVFRELPVYRRMSIEVGYRERNLDTAGNPLPTELLKRSTRIPFMSVGLPIGPTQLTFDYEHRHDSDAVRAPLSSDTDRFAFGYRASYSWGRWGFNPLFRFELERLNKNVPVNPQLSATDPTLIFPIDFADAFDMNRSVQAGFLLETPRYFRFEGLYREFNSLTLSSLRASSAFDPQLRFFYLNQGFKRPSWRGSVTYKLANDENKTVTVFYERTNNFFDPGDPFVADLKSFRETVIGATILVRSRW